MIGVRSKDLGTIQTAFCFHESVTTLNQTFRHEELHVFIVDEKDLDSSVQTFMDLFALRTWSRKEIWLVDIGHLTENVRKDRIRDKLKSTFKDLILDLDDDLYFYSGEP